VNREGRAQPSQRDARLMQRAGIAALDHRRGVEAEMAQAAAGDGAKRLRRRDPGRQRHRPGLFGWSRRREQPVAAVGLAEYSDLHRGCRIDPAGEGE
jgi:hypothetical protein